MVQQDTEPGERVKPNSAAPPPELHSEQDMLAWKREYNIRQREADWKRRQEEMLTQKQVQWEISRCERENRLASAREQRRKEELEARVYTKHVEIDRRYKDRCRAVEIDKRNATWEERENNRLVVMHREAQQRKEVQNEALLAEKERLCGEMRDAAAERAAAKKRNEELQKKREENIKRKELERQKKAAQEALKLKTDNTAKSEAIVNEFTERTVPSSDGPFIYHGRTDASRQNGGTRGIL
eukprot:TRINITY_DN80073_c0_g1_i1.p2 TRINITY_DN80073_c0_g1~~TRINITY_DN80073_c0_g1_i1.p2  ORF type:complete len:241 (+),score=84.63 TRINITY_DN80073_c0_g1_i1:99-821(+)